jgi:hypothetical protein
MKDEDVWNRFCEKCRVRVSPGKKKGGKFFFFFNDNWLAGLILHSVREYLFRRTGIKTYINENHNDMALVDSLSQAVFLGGTIFPDFSRAFVVVVDDRWPYHRYG